MTREVIYVVYGISLVLTVSPLLHILVRCKLSRYFVYFVATSSFVVLDLVGSISPNVLGEEPALDFHLALFCIAFALFLLYFAIDAMAPRQATAPLALRLLDSARETRLALACYIGFLLLVGLVGSIAFYLTISPPLLLQFDLLGSAGVLIGRRVEITLSRPYHWFALVLFEIPLFTVILLNVLRQIRGPWSGLWRWLFWLVAPVATVASVMILQKQNILYLLVSFLLVLIAFRNRVPVRPLVAIGLAGAVALWALYRIIFGPQFTQLIPSSIAHRFIEVAPWSSAIAFGLFPRELPFLEGTSFINFFQMFEYEQANPAKLIYPLLYGNDSGQAPLPAVTEMYVNYGWLGIGIGILLAMALVFLVSVLSWSKDVWSFGLAVYLTIKMVFIWLVPFWFGTLEATLVLLVLVLFATFRIVRVLTEKRPVGRPSLEATC